jgi:hypothetical protein
MVAKNKKIILFILILIISINFLTGCSNRNNTTNSKLNIKLIDYREGKNFTGESFKDLYPAPDGKKYFYADVIIYNVYYETIRVNQYFFKLYDEEGLSEHISQKTGKLKYPFLKTDIEPGDSYQAQLLFQIPNYSIPTKLIYNDTVLKNLNINITIPIN